jgi:biopolymer transport protein ExbB
VGFTVFCAFFLYTATAHAWWNEDWSMRRSIDLNTTAQGADIQEAVVNVPILLRLHAGNFDFKKTKPDGSDIRFVASDDQTPLKHTIDTYDVIDEIALIWVNVPEIKANASDSHIFMYYGNEKAVDGQDGPAVFANGQALVFHLGESEGTPQDATVNKNHSSHFSGGLASPSVVGKGISFFGNRDRITVPHSPSLNLAQGFTLSAWVKIKHPGTDGYLFSQTEHEKGLIIGIDGETVYARVINNGAVIQTEGDARITQGNWHHLAVTAKPGGKLSLFIDGQEVAGAPLPGELPTLITDLFFGSADTEGHQLAADLDEIHLSTLSRTPAWIKTVFASQGIQSKLVVYGAETSDGGGSFLPTYYLKTITAHITVDGWLIIILLVILGLGAMFVLVNKSLFFYLNQKDNKNFQESFSRLDNLFSPEPDFENCDNSSLCRIYRAGSETVSNISRRNADEEELVLGIKEMNFLKASLEKSYVQETKKFNNWIMVMTLAISGGPFLGLLGTVWGVMNTFAAMAEAGEANIMAIAPGIASALATTVFGLIVAIPALFGYNYLAGKIKDLTADLGLFIDEFILLVERDHGAEQ